MKKSHLEKVKEQYDKVLATMNKFARFGACDTEPDGELQVIIRDTLRGEEPKIKSTARFWQLYSMKGAGIAAVNIARATKKRSKGTLRRSSNWATRLSTLF